jgi:hypothetical protein
MSGVLFAPVTETVEICLEAEIFREYTCLVIPFWVRLRNCPALQRQEPDSN